MRHRNNNPYWLAARFASKCSQCGATIPKGSQIFYYPINRHVLCSAPACGGAAAADYNSHAFDESVMGGAM